MGRFWIVDSALFPERERDLSTHKICKAVCRHVLHINEPDSLLPQSENGRGHALKQPAAYQYFSQLKVRAAILKHDSYSVHSSGLFILLQLFISLSSILPVNIHLQWLLTHHLTSGISDSVYSAHIESDLMTRTLWKLKRDNSAQNKVMDYVSVSPRIRRRDWW